MDPFKVGVGYSIMPYVLVQIYIYIYYFNGEWVLGFCFSILWFNWNDDHPQDDLVRFGYILDMKIETKSKSFYIFGYSLD